MRVLVVDDDIIIRHYFVRSLRRYVEVEQATGFAEALAKIRRSSFDVVLTDEHMPDGSGRALLAHVSTLQTRCRRVLMSGSEHIVQESTIEREQSRPNTRVYERFFAKADGLTPMVTWIRVLASELQVRRAERGHLESREGRTK